MLVIDFRVVNRLLLKKKKLFYHHYWKNIIDEEYNKYKYNTQTQVKIELVTLI